MENRDMEVDDRLGKNVFKTVLITGGTGLVASAQVRYLIKHGWRVVITYRDEEKFEQLKGSTGLLGVNTPDLLQPGAVKAIVEELGDRGLYPDCLINNACDLRWHKIEPDGHVSEECFVNQYRINVVVPYELSWQLLNAKGSRLRKIINVSSMYGIVPHNPQLYSHPETETPLQYSLSKSALIHLTKDLAIRFRDRGVIVNTVSYGGIEGRADDEFKKRFAIVTPLRRMMTPEETIPAIEFLLNENSGYMTGQNIVVDGGRTVW